MNRQIKFRIWIESEKPRMEDWEWIKRNWHSNILDKAMQYTGLKDKNGKEIYEGDVLNFNPVIAFSEDELGGTVVWDSEWSSFKVETKSGNFISIHYSGNTDLVEIIGNIYENPELLK